MPAMFGKIKDIFSAKERVMGPIDFKRIKTDVHSHFIPGIDDGAPDMDHSMELISAMSEMGYSKVITTPHVMSDFYRNTPDMIRSGLDAVREELVKRQGNIEIDCAAENYLDAELMDKVKKKELLTFGDNYVLFELPFISEPPNTTDIIFEMQLAGYKPVLAHPERYAFYHRQFEKYTEYADKGVLLQLNMNSLTGHYSPEVKKIAERMVDENLISLIGSDCHHYGHIQLLEQASKGEAMHKLLDSGKLINTSL